MAVTLLTYAVIGSFTFGAMLQIISLVVGFFIPETNKYDVTIFFIGTVFVLISVVLFITLGLVLLFIL